MTSTTTTTKTSTRTKEIQTPPHHQQEKGKLNTINPATEEVIKQYEIMVKEQINERIKMARNTFEVWKKDINKRIDSLHDLAAELRKNKGYFYKPTVIKDVSSKMRIAQEEIFGPVAPIITVDNEAEAIKLANDTQYGLGASIWTQDLNKAEKLSDQIQSGLVTVNNIVASDPRVPFGGVKKSGFGRELSRYGMMEFANIKSVRFYDELVDYHHVE